MYSKIMAQKNAEMTDLQGQKLYYPSHLKYLINVDHQHLTSPEPHPVFLSYGFNHWHPLVLVLHPVLQRNVCAKYVHF